MIEARMPASSTILITSLYAGKEPSISIDCNREKARKRLGPAIQTRIAATGSDIPVGAWCRRRRILENGKGQQRFPAPCDWFGGIAEHSVPHRQARARVPWLFCSIRFPITRIEKSDNPRWRTTLHCQRTGEESRRARFRAEFRCRRTCLSHKPLQHGGQSAHGRGPCV